MSVDNFLWKGSTLICFWLTFSVSKGCPTTTESDPATPPAMKSWKKDTSSSVVAKVSSPPSRGSLWSISCLCSIATLFCRNWSSFFKFYGHFSWLLNNSRSYLSHLKIKRSKGWRSQVSQLVHRKRIPSANATVRRRYYGRWEFCTPTSYLSVEA